MTRILFSLLFLGSFLISCSSEAQKPDDKATKDQSPSTEVDAPAEDAGPQLENVGVDRFEELISAEGMQILDVRTPEEIAQGYVAGATTINIHDADFESRVTEALQKDKPVTVYCKSGGRSARAASLLQEIGFSKIYNYTGGMSEWNRMEKPTVTN